MDNASFFFSFEFDLPQTALEPLSGGLRNWAAKLCKKTLAARVFIVQNELCLPLKDSPCHHTRSGIDWPDMWRYRPLPTFMDIPSSISESYARYCRFTPVCLHGPYERQCFAPNPRFLAHNECAVESELVGGPVSVFARKPA